LLLILPSLQYSIVKVAATTSSGNTTSHCIA
jgi:hypothetical protein